MSHTEPLFRESNADEYRKLMREQQSWMQRGDIFVLIPPKDIKIHELVDYAKACRAELDKWLRAHQGVNVQMHSLQFFVAIDDKPTAVEFKLTFC